MMKTFWNCQRRLPLEWLSCRTVAVAVGAGGLLLGFMVPSLASQSLALSDAASASDSSASELSATVAMSKSAATEDNRLVLSLRSRRVYLYQGEMLISSYPVAVGTAETPTPQGEFSVSKMVVDPVWQSPWTGEVHEPGPNSALGLRWIEFASTEAGSFGFHGTPTVESIGHAASNGCVRMYNEDVVALFSQVSVGTPVLVVQ
ncbi:MAG: L,D-transpeptidase [Cyanobacteria bacterium J06643_4]